MSEIQGDEPYTDASVSASPAADDGWQRHSGGPNPRPGKLVDLIWGAGVIERQPSERVNWIFHWMWRPSAAGQTLTGKSEDGSSPLIKGGHSHEG